MRTYIYPYFPLPYAMQLLVSPDRIQLRSFRFSGGVLNHSHVLSLADAQELLDKPATPFIPGRATPAWSWFPRAALTGNWAGGPATINGAGSFLQEISQVVFTLDPTILGSAALSEHAEWIVPCNTDGRLGIPMNRTLLTWPSRAHKTAIYQERQQCSALTLMMPYADMQFSRATLYAKMNPAFGLLHDFADPVVVSTDGIQLDGYETRTGLPALWPRLQLAGPDTLQAGAFATYGVSLHDGDTGFALDESGMRVELEASAGYLAHRVLHLQQGSAGFSLAALGLEAGDRIKLKAGWRYFPGAAEKEIDIV